jgi:asparagine synthase (glutamine-hydrolysing)
LAIFPHHHHLQEEFFQETVRKVQALYQFDCLRANKSTMAWGVEARVPFLDKQFLNVAMAIDPAEKMINKAEGELLVVSLALHSCVWRLRLPTPVGLCWV